MVRNVPQWRHSIACFSLMERSSAAVTGGRSP
jgi:hypothetical protein